MQLTLIESDRSFLRSTECAALSIVAHGVLVWAVLAAPGTRLALPATERDARLMLLLPPDRVPASERTAELPRPGQLGAGYDEGHSLEPGEGFRVQPAVSHARNKGVRSGTRQDLPVKPTTFVPDSVYSVLQVDQMVERFESSAAPVYPPELMRRGVQGQVDATYVVDTTGRVDPSTFQVLASADSLFTASVRTALADTRFRPARRAGKAVRQLVAQRFRFKIANQAQPLQ
ncbi:MAG TPA: TonB family protein [Gemmatimonadales bacterium]|nr:TonB family protein [Gemmatimonadales bacterium]